MRPHTHNAPAFAEIAGWLFDLVVRLIARLLQMPAPLVHAVGLFVYAQVQEADRRLLALCRPSR